MWSGWEGVGLPAPHLLLLQADDRAVAATAALPLESGDLLSLDTQDLLMLLVLQLQLLCRGEEAVGCWKSIGRG